MGMPDRNVTSLPYAATSINSEEVEQALLGALLVSDKLFDTIPTVRAEWFYTAVHGRIYEIIRRIKGQGGQATPAAVAQYIGNDRDLQDVGGAEYIRDLADNVVTVTGAAHHVQMLQQMHQRRALLVLARHLHDMSLQADMDTSPAALMAQAEAFIAEATESGRETTLLSMADCYAPALAAAKKPVSGLSTGLPRLTACLRGLQRKRVYVLGGRPGMGKSAAAVTIGVNVAEKGGRVQMFSLEMEHTELMQRIMSRYSDRAVHSGGVRSDEWDEVESKTADITKMPFWIDDAAGLTITEIFARARRQKRTNGLDLLIIDHLGLIVPEDRRANRVHQVGEITNMIKRMAKELDVPVLLLCQLSRAVEGRDDKRPTMSDLRDSGEIEQDADVVIFLYRHEYYLEREKPDTAKMGDQRAAAALGEWQDAMTRAKGKIDLIVAKNRSGEMGIIHAKADLARQVIYE